MRNYILHVVILLPALLFSIMMPAADLPTLPVASQIRTGMLDNGVAFYLVTNHTEKGKADVALVQKGGYGCETPLTAGSSAVHAMGSLTMLPHFRTNTPFNFLSDNCIWPGKDGYVAVYEDATIYRFSNLELSRSKDIVDSTLLMVFDIIGMQSEYIGGRYSPQNQAIVVSGDIDAGAVLNKMNMLSMLVVKGRPAKVNADYVWQSASEAKYENEKPSVRGQATISAEYIYPRTPEKNMNTVQPLVSQKFASELGIVLKKRLSHALREAGIPVADISYSYISSKDGPGNEKVRISITTSDKCLEEASAVLSGTLASLKTYGTSPEEYRDAQAEMVMNMMREYSGDVKSNTGYVEQCISSYLYGASLASAATSMDFFIKKNLQDDLSARLFNNFVTALIDKSGNLTFRCVCDSLAGENAFRKFNDSWTPKETGSYTVSYADTLKLKKSSSKLKLKAMSPETLSGGQVWTFDNGLKVIFKYTPKTRMFHYLWLLKGGYTMVPGLKPGEGAYVSDMLGLYDVPGMSCYSFAQMLSANGISMDGEVTMSDLRISGAAPSSRLQLLLRSLYSLAQNGTMNRDAYNYYRDCQSVKMLAGASPQATLDSLLFPGNAWSTYKRPITLADDFQKRSDKFFKSEFSKMNDGVLILVGDFDEYTLKKDLSRYLGGFSTDKATSFRSRSQYKSGSGNACKIVIGDRQTMDLGASAPLNYTSANYMASYIAGMALQARLSETLARSGWYGSATWDFSMFPEERFNFKMHCSMSERIGVPASLVQVDSVGLIISDVRRALRTASIDQKELNVCKSVLLKSIEARLSDPQMIMSMLALRYSYGKDLVTRYKDNINAVNVATVNDILKGLAGGRTAEYAVRTRLEGEQIIDTQRSPVFTGVIPRLVPASDTLGIARQAFRVIGIDTAAYTPVWKDSAAFVKLLPLLPEPLKFQPAEPVKVKTDTLTVNPADSMAINPADSTVFVPVDSSAVVPVDSTVVVPVDSTMTVPRDSISVVPADASGITRY